MLYTLYIIFQTSQFKFYFMLNSCKIRKIYNIFTRLGKVKIRIFEQKMSSTFEKAYKVFILQDRFLN